MTKQKMQLVIGVTLAALAFIVVIYLRFTNIDMTEARLLVTYWKEWLFILVAAMTGGYLIRSSER